MLEGRAKGQLLGSYSLVSTCEEITRAHGVRDGAGLGRGRAVGAELPATHSSCTYILQDTDGHIAEVFAMTAHFLSPRPRLPSPNVP